MHSRTACLLVLAAASLGACANTQSMRTLAAKSATYASGEAKSGESYLQAFNDSAALQRGRTTTYLADAAQQRDEMNLNLRFWAVAGRDGPAKRLDALRLSSPEDIVAVATPAPAAAPAAAPATLGYADTAKLLAALAVKPSALDQVGSVIGFAQSVSAALTKIKADAATQASAATPAAPTAVTAASKN